MSVIPSCLAFYVSGSYNKTTCLTDSANFSSRKKIPISVKLFSLTLLLLLLFISLSCNYSNTSPFFLF